MQRSQKEFFRKIFFIPFIFFLAAGIFFPANLNENFPVIDLVKIPRRVEVGKYFTVTIKVKSKNPILFFNVFIEESYKKIPAKKIFKGVYSIRLMVKKSGIKKMRTFAIDSKGFSGKSYNSTFFAYMKIKGLFNSEVGLKTKAPQKPAQIKIQALTFGGAPPVINLDRYTYCKNDRIIISGKYFTKDLKARIGIKKVDIKNIKPENLEIVPGSDTISDFLYLKNNFGETKSQYKLIIGAIPEIEKITPSRAGQGDLIGITGKNLSGVNQVALRIRSDYVDEVFYLKIIEKPEETHLKTRMPNILHYPGKYTLDLHSRCGYGKEYTINIPREKVTLLRPQLKEIYNKRCAPGSTVFIYLDKISIPKKKEFKVTFNFIEGEVTGIKYSKTDKYKLTVKIPEDVDNTVGYNQKVRIYAFGHEIISKDNFYLYGRPEITGIGIAPWSDRFIEIEGHNFKKDHSYVYFFGSSGNWIKADQVNSLGFDKVAAKIPFNVVKGRIKVETHIDGIWQERISTMIFDPEPEESTGK